MPLYEENPKVRQLYANNFRLEKKIKWLKIIVVMLIAIIIYFMVKNYHTNQLVEDYHGGNSHLTAAYVASAHSDVLRALEFHDKRRMELIKSAQQNLEFASDNMRTYNAWFNFYGDKKNTVIGGGRTGDFFSLYIYTLNEWKNIYGTDGEEVDDQTLSLFAGDLEAMTQLFHSYINVEYHTEAPETLSYESYIQAFRELIESAETDFLNDNSYYDF